MAREDSIYVAAATGDINTLKRLINAENVNAPDSNGNTPLHMAAAAGNIKAISFLLDHGAKINTPDNNGNTSLHMAAAAGRRDVIEPLILAGANVNAQNQDGNTPLHLAMANFAQKDTDPALSRVIERLARDPTTNKTLKNKVKETPAKLFKNYGGQIHKFGFAKYFTAPPRTFTTMFRHAKETDEQKAREVKHDIQQKVDKGVRKIIPRKK